MVKFALISGCWWLTSSEIPQTLCHRNRGSLTESGQKMANDPNIRTLIISHSQIREKKRKTFWGRFNHYNVGPPR